MITRARDAFVPVFDSRIKNPAAPQSVPPSPRREFFPNHRVLGAIIRVKASKVLKKSEKSPAVYVIG